MISDKPRKRRPVALLQHVALLFVIGTIPCQRGTSVERHVPMSVFCPWPVRSGRRDVWLRYDGVLVSSGTAAGANCSLDGRFGRWAGRSLERFLTLTGLFAAKNILPRLPIGSM
jgi:hypothetical protein